MHRFINRSSPFCTSFSFQLDQECLLACKPVLVPPILEWTIKNKQTKFYSTSFHSYSHSNLHLWQNSSNKWCRFSLVPLFSFCLKQTPMGKDYTNPPKWWLQVASMSLNKFTFFPSLINYIFFSSFFTCFQCITHSWLTRIWLTVPQSPTLFPIYLPNFLIYKYS